MDHYGGYILALLALLYCLWLFGVGNPFLITEEKRNETRLKAESICKNQGLILYNFTIKNNKATGFCYEKMVNSSIYGVYLK